MRSIIQYATHSTNQHDDRCLLMRCFGLEMSWEPHRSVVVVVVVVVVVRFWPKSRWQQSKYIVFWLLKSVATITIIIPYTYSITFLISRAIGTWNPPWFAITSQIITMMTNHHLNHQNTRTDNNNYNWKCDVSHWAAHSMYDAINENWQHRNFSTACCTLALAFFLLISISQRYLNI